MIIQENLENLEYNQIIKIEKLYDKYDDYVYDIETELGIFNGGIGELVLKNTDSIFTDLGLKKK